MSPTQRSLKLLRDEGWLAVVVERWNPYAKIRQDLLRFGDILAIRNGVCSLVQSTTGHNLKAREDKILSEPNAAAWLSVQSHIIELHGWRKIAPRGKRKKWDCNRQLILFQTTMLNEAGDEVGTVIWNPTPPTVGDGSQNLPASPVSGTPTPIYEHQHETSPIPRRR